MTTPTLTHEQAALLRSVNAHVVIYIGGPIIGDWDASAYIEEYCGSAPAELTPAGRKALAAHDRENITISTKTMVLARETLALMIDDHGRKMIDQPERLAGIEPLRVALAEINVALAAWEAAECSGEAKEAE